MRVLTGVLLVLLLVCGADRAVRAYPMPPYTTAEEPPQPGLLHGLAWLADRATDLMRDLRVLALMARAQDAMLGSRFDAAYTDLTAAISLDPTNPALYVMRGQASLALYAWDASEADYNWALALDPGYADAYFYRGVLRYSILQTGLGLRTAAQADFEQYLSLAPQGRHAAEAARYAESIQRELDALTGDA
ncbi:hypothetical protein HC928_13720 [bacterium]|nr:hypothetical protein [bacterium]